MKMKFFCFSISTNWQSIFFCSFSLNRRNWIHKSSYFSFLVSRKAMDKWKQYKTITIEWLSGLYTPNNVFFIFVVLKQLCVLCVTVVNFSFYFFFPLRVPSCRYVTFIALLLVSVIIIQSFWMTLNTTL